MYALAFIKVSADERRKSSITGNFTDDHRLYNIFFMKRVVLLLPLALSPVYAIGFWGSFGSGLSFGGLSEWKWKEVSSESNYSQILYDTLWATPGRFASKI
jgi:hypothetical protein